MRMIRASVAKHNHNYSEFLAAPTAHHRRGLGGVFGTERRCNRSI
jgi:hypothetical protein